jgi:hypothetical protein
MSRSRQFLLLLTIITGLFVSAVAQTPQDHDDNQSWNDLQISIPIAEKVDLLVLGTVRFGGNFTNFIEGRAGGGVSVKLSKRFSISPTYQHIETRAANGTFRTEHRYSMRGSYKFPFKRFGLSHKSTYEYRVRSSGNSWRYRPAVTFEKALPKSFLPKAKFFITEDPFYISTTRRFSRNRLSLGVSKTLSKHFTLNVYYLRQDDNTSVPGNLNVLGTTWKVNL